MARTLLAVLVAVSLAACFDAPSDGRDAGSTGSGGGAGGAAGGGSGGGSGGGVGGGTGSCSDDSQEPNDNPDSGTATNTRMYIIGSPQIAVDAMACAGDEDWYRGYADCCPGFGVTVSWDAGMGALDVALLDPSFNDLRVDGGVEARPGYIKLTNKSQGGYFFARIRSSNADIPYSVLLQAPVYGP